MAGPPGVLEAPPLSSSTSGVDDVGHGPAERRALLVDLDGDVEVGGQPDRARQSSTIDAISAASNMTSVNVSGVTVTRPQRCRLACAASVCGCHLGHLPRLLGRLAGDLGEVVHLLVGEAGQLAEAAGEADGAVVVLAAEPAEREQLVDDALELEGPLAALRVVVGEPAQPVGAHLHVGDLVGQHPVLAELEHRVARLVAELPIVLNTSMARPSSARFTPVRRSTGSGLQAAS